MRREQLGFDEAADRGVGPEKDQRHQDQRERLTGARAVLIAVNTGTETSIPPKPKT